jgi:hypothetical protein
MAVFRIGESFRDGEQCIGDSFRAGKGDIEPQIVRNNALFSQYGLSGRPTAERVAINRHGYGRAGAVHSILASHGTGSFP